MTDISNSDSILHYAMGEMPRRSKFSGLSRFLLVNVFFMAAFIISLSIKNSPEHGCVKSIEYHSSEMEKDWIENIDEWQKEGEFCEQIKQQQERIDMWLQQIQTKNFGKISITKIPQLFSAPAEGFTSMYRIFLVHSNHI